VYTKTVASDIIREYETDSQWQSKLGHFLQSAQRQGRGVLIDYVYEPPNRVVPQRLYRYDIFDDYVSRHRDDFEFGYDLITGAQHITNRRSYGLYVIEINHNPNHVYVGQTWYEPEERLAQHLTGLAVFHAARPFKRPGTTGRLRPDLYQHIPRVPSQSRAEQLEAHWALQLRKAGFRVEGGH
jgi:hypothetical protein